MRNLLFLFLGFIFSQILDAQTFEGIIKTTFQNEQGKVDYIHLLRNDQNATWVSVSAEVPVNTTIFYNKSTQLIRLAYENAGQKIRTKWMPTSIINATNTLNYSMLVVTETNEYKEILGHNCRKYVFDFPTHKISTFIANDIVIDRAAYTAYQKDDMVLNTMIFKEIKGYALESEIEQKMPLQISRTKVTSIENKHLEDSFFEIDETYKEQ